MSVLRDMIDATMPTCKSCQWNAVVRTLRVVDAFITSIDIKYSVDNKHIEYLIGLEFSEEIENGWPGCGDECEDRR